MAKRLVREKIVKRHFEITEKQNSNRRSFFVAERDRSAILQMMVDC